jgi:cation:H+ antiporter
MAFLLFSIGAALLFVGGDWLVRGATGFAERGGLKPVIAAATIVALGASAPEVSVALTASLRGAPAVAAAMIAGANVANLLLVLGAALLFSPILTSTPGARRGAIAAVLACICASLATFLGTTQWMVAAAALCGAGLYVVMLVREAERETLDPELADAAQIYAIEKAPAALFANVGLIVVGVIFLSVGAHFALSGARSLANAGGDQTAGAAWLGVAAVLPELGMALAAALRGRTGLILPAVFGGIVFNVLAVGGLAALAAPLPLGLVSVQLDFLVMTALCGVVGLAVLIGKPLPRVFGYLALIGYAGFLFWVAR